MCNYRMLISEIVWRSLEDESMSGVHKPPPSTVTPPSSTKIQARITQQVDLLVKIVLWTCVGAVLFRADA